MRGPSVAVAVVASVIVAVPLARAQEAPALSPGEVAAACAPPPAVSQTPHALRVVGSQDTVPRAVFDTHDLLVINGGTDAGVQLGAQFFVRRPSAIGKIFGTAGESDILTDGWIRIVAVNDSTSVARVERVCGPIYIDDYLEPFAAPSGPAAADGPLEPDFAAMGRILGGSDGRALAGTSGIAFLDRGSEQGLQPGARFAIYRDLTAGFDPLLAAPSGTPLTAIGEGVVLSTSGDRAVARIVRARDAVRAGDYAVPQKH